MDDYISDDNFDIDIFKSYYSDEDNDNEDGGDKSDEDKCQQQQRGERYIDF
jgi:hypothetical protein